MPATRPAAASRPRAGYVARVDSLDSVDARVVQGRRIVLDPGHGGFFPGSIGVNGLTEAEVNLGVALRLRDLLVARGAQVLLTRATDRDFLTPADSALRADLAMRVELANAFHPDVFLSIHHNADAAGAHDRNETQTYYKLGDDGPAFELGEDVHAAMARNLGIEIARLLPGNFFVVRGSNAPALLSEASYLTNPDVEARLRTPEARQLEAEALYLGIARWFARKRPEFAEVALVGGSGDSDTLLSVGRPIVAARLAGAFDEVNVWFDGVAASVDRAQDRIWAQPATPLAAGRHEVVLRARLATEGSARLSKKVFRVHKGAPTSVTHEARRLVAPGCEPLAEVRSRALDRDGLPYADSLQLRVQVVGAPGVLPRDTMLWFRDGRALAYLHAAPGHTLPVRLNLRASAFLPGAKQPTLPARTIPALPTAAGARHAFLRVLPADTVLCDAPGTEGAAPRLAWLGRTGLLELRTNEAGVSVMPRIAGFRPVGPDTAWPPRVTAVAGGALLARRIVLDPEGGGDDAAGLGPRGTRGSALNLEVARALAGMLRGAGAEVALTRSSDVAVSEVERVATSEAFGADRYLRIGHAAAPPMAGHYWSSAGGKRWAGRVAGASVALGLDSARIGESAKYPITQVAAVALYASLARIDSSETMLRAPGRLRAEAYALYLALARDFMPSADWSVDSLTVLDAEGRKVAGAPVTFGGALTLATDERGILRFARTEPGPIELTVEDPRVRLRTLLLESEHGRTLTGAR
ncbi:MAG: N-acetylmuramoyl-L-alanine amidase [Candidatus Eisenbacteria bacterium]